VSKVTVVIPALNEEEGIETTIRAIPTADLVAMGHEVQILIVDNGSTDRTAELAKRAGAEVVFEPERGYGRAYKTGFAHALGDIIATADADGSYPVDGIPKLIKMLSEEGLDFISTNRFEFMTDGAMSAAHRVGNLILNLVTRILFGINLRDSQSGMWVFRRDLLDRLALSSDSMSFSEEVKIAACHFLRCRWKEVPISYRARIGTVKLRTWRHGLENFAFLVKMRLAR